MVDADWIPSFDFFYCVASIDELLFSVGSWKQSFIIIHYNWKKLVIGHYFDSEFQWFLCSAWILVNLVYCILSDILERENAGLEWS